MTQSNAHNIHDDSVASDDYPQFEEKISSFLHYKQSFILHPEMWASLKLTEKLEWNSVPFGVDPSHVPEIMGVYAFVLSIHQDFFPINGYIMYIGKCGAENQSTNRTIRKRYTEYLKEKVKLKRPRIYDMVNKWKDNLYFTFAEIKKTDRIGYTEDQLINSIIPPANAADFKAEIRNFVTLAYGY